MKFDGYEVEKVIMGYNRAFAGFSALLYDYKDLSQQLVCGILCVEVIGFHIKPASLNGMAAV